MSLTQTPKRRMAISGIIASLILFVMLFTVGTGFFLWINVNNASFSQAQANRNNMNQAQQAENISLCPGTYTGGVCAPSLTLSNHLQFGAANQGSGTTFLTYLYVTDSTGRVVKQGAITPNIVLNAGSQTPSSCGQCDTGFTYTSGVVTIKVVSLRGNTFTTVYPAQRTSPNPSIFTQIQPSSTVPQGQTVYDTATLIGVSSTAGGSVGYNFFSNAACAGAATATTTVPVKNGNVPASNTVSGGSETASTVGTPSNPFPYSWNAVYSGDANNPGPVVSSCEPLTVTPSLTTSLSSQIAVAPASVYDSAVLGGAPTASGTVNYFFSSLNTCPANGATLAGTVAVSSGVVPNSPPSTFSAPGVYFWYATYSGDANDLAVTSSCEPLTVQSNGQTQLPLALQLSSFKFYYAQSYLVGDGFPVGGYYGEVVPSSSPGTVSPSASLIFAVTLQNVDPQGRSVSINDLSFMFVTVLSGGGGQCYSYPLYILGGISDSAPYTAGVTATAFTSLPTLGYGKTTTIYFGSQTPGTASLYSTTIQCFSGAFKGAVWEATVAPFIAGTYSDASPLSLTLPFTSVYVTPGSVLNSVSPPGCTPSSGGIQCTAKVGDSVTLSFHAGSFVSNPSVYGIIGGSPTLLASCSSTTTCSFTVPSTGVTAGGYYTLFASDVSNYAYATLHVIANLMIAPSTFAHNTGTHTITLSASNLQPSSTFSYCLSTSSTSISCVATPSIASPSPGTFASTAGGAIPSGTTVVTTNAITAGTYYIIIYQGSQIIGLATLTVT